MAEEKKIKKYADVPPHFQFVPIALETMGGYGVYATQFLKDVSKRQKEIFGDKSAGCKLKQRLSVELQRGNARCIMFALKN